SATGTIHTMSGVKSVSRVELYLTIAMRATRASATPMPIAAAHRHQDNRAVVSAMRANDKHCDDQEAAPAIVPRALPADRLECHRHSMYRRLTWLFVSLMLIGCLAGVL